jgi:hypothetical protein
MLALILVVLAGRRSDYAETLPLLLTADHSHRSLERVPSQLSVVVCGRRCAHRNLKYRQAPIKGLNAWAVRLWGTVWATA